MNERLIAVRQPRKLTKLELTDIHVLVKATRPVLSYTAPAQRKTMEANKREAES